MKGSVNALDTFLPPATKADIDAVRQLELATLAEELTRLHLPARVSSTMLRLWPTFVGQPEWVTWLARLRASLRRDRGVIEAPIGIWDDFEDTLEGRLLYHYLLALEIPNLDAYWDALGVPEDVRDTTLSALARHGETHEIKHGTMGVDAGWWILLLARGDLLQIGELKFHRFILGRNTLTPEPWLDDAAQAAMGEGFRVGDESVGLHIPARSDLSSSALAATFTRAGEVLAAVWPTTQRRLVTCQSWLLDDAFVPMLGPTSRLVQFQGHFTMIEPSQVDDGLVSYFVFNCPEEEARRRAPRTRLEAGIQEFWDRGGHWRNRIGWLELP